MNFGIPSFMTIIILCLFSFSFGTLSTHFSVCFFISYESILIVRYLYVYGYVYRYLNTILSFFRLTVKTYTYI